MKILLTTTYYHPYVSGLTVYAKRLAEGLVKSGSEVTVVAMQHDRTLATGVDLGGVKIVRARPILKINKGFLSIDYIRRIGQETRKADGVIVNLPQVEGWIAAVLGRIWKKRVVAIYTCDVVVTNPIVQSGLDWCNYLTLAMVHRIVTYTEDFARHSPMLRGFEDKTEWCYPPIPDLPVDERLRQELKKRIGKTKIVIGIAARLAAEKGVEYLIEAMPLLEEKLGSQAIKIVIAGPMDPVGEEGYKKKIVKLVEKQKDKIVFLGSITPEKMGAFYSLVDILVLPSINSTEAFGMVQAEAMRAGVPVVASDLPGVREAVRVTGMGEICAAKSSWELADKIKKVIANRDKYILRQNDAKRIFGEASVVKFYEKIFREILSE